ncbi:jg24491 [Pararge aegeria aegeria]|uniref:Jg24491 protein n=1 Tax=Pararge aegeria aegeria TaxID=348720 RepID=A0A8S4RHN6_9NEOP|nr:jg24491 [Pararge aegeria aegeria]
MLTDDLFQNMVFNYGLHRKAVTQRAMARAILGWTTSNASQGAIGHLQHKTVEFGTTYERPMSSFGRLRVDMLTMSFENTWSSSSIEKLNSEIYYIEELSSSWSHQGRRWDPKRGGPALDSAVMVDLHEPKGVARYQRHKTIESENPYKRPMLSSGTPVVEMISSQKILKEKCQVDVAREV